MDKKPSFLWAIAIGILFPVLQVVTFFLRFQNINPDAGLTDYLYFFVAGLLIGVILIYFLRRSDSSSAYRGAMIGFIIGVPLALIGMLLGGLVGAFGAILFGISPNIFTIAVGYFIGRATSKK